MADLTLYYCPVTCARVSLVALEEVGASFRLQVVDLLNGENRTPNYLAINPKGKVPALRIDTTILTETPAILTWLARTYRDAALLPLGASALDDAFVQSDLTYVSAGFHPIVTRMCRPQMFCNTPGGIDGVYAMAAEMMAPNFQIVEDRLRDRPWWYGDAWSMMDVYLDWIWYRVASTPFDLSRYPNFARHGHALAERPSVQRAERRGAEAARGLSERTR